jgi:predicted amidophosphoribosyltransferase
MMPSVTELSGPYENFMLCPQPGPGICERCFNFTAGYERCYACSRGGSALSVVVPISYSIGGEQLHHALAAYKRYSDDAARRLTLGIAAVLWRFLLRHEQCVARATGVSSFPVVTTVPSSVRALDRHRFDEVVSELVGPVRERYRKVLRRTGLDVAPREFSPHKYAALRPFDGEPVLLLDDTWTTGANAQSAAAALIRAGSGPVAVVVVGRHVNRGWRDNDRRLQALPRPFDWRMCAICRGSAQAALDPAA